MREYSGVTYAPNSDKPYTGKVFSLYDDGKKKEEGKYRDGKNDGLVTWWYENGQKEEEGNWKNGEDVGKWTYWYENGNKKSEGTYKDGDVIYKECWNRNGNECECGKIFWSGCK